MIIEGRPPAIALAIALLFVCGACNPGGSDGAAEPQAPSEPSGLASEPVAADGAGSAATPDAETKAALAAAKAKYDPLGKFAFALDELGSGTRSDANGNQLPIRYEFCVPKAPEPIKALASLDSTIIVETNDKGEIGCDDDHLLAHGHTGQPDYLLVLSGLAKQDFVEKIILAE